MPLGQTERLNVGMHSAPWLQWSLSQIRDDPFNLRDRVGKETLEPGTQVIQPRLAICRADEAVFRTLAPAIPSSFSTRPSRGSPKMGTAQSLPSLGRPASESRGSTREFLAHAEARVVAGRCLSYGEGVTYWPVVEVVKQLDDVAAPLRADPAVAPAIGALLGEGPAATPGEIVWATRKLLETAAAERPIVAVFDDIHWGEPAFLDLVEHIADLSDMVRRFSSCAWRGPNCSTAGQTGAEASATQPRCCSSRSTPATSTS